MDPPKNCPTPKKLSQRPLKVLGLSLVLERMSTYQREFIMFVSSFQNIFLIFYIIFNSVTSAAMMVVLLVREPWYHVQSGPVESLGPGIGGNKNVTIIMLPVDSQTQAGLPA